MSTKKTAKAEKPAKEKKPGKPLAPTSPPAAPPSNPGSPAAVAAAPGYSETGPAEKLGRGRARAPEAVGATRDAHDALEAGFDHIKKILTSTAQDPKNPPRQLRWALKALDAAHVAAKTHVDRNV